MKLAIASLHDLNDVRRGSGTYFHMIEELERQGHIVTRLGPFTLEVPFTARAIHFLHRLSGRRHALFLDPFVGRHTGRQVARQLAGHNYDILLTMDVCMAAFTPTPKKVALYTDVMITPDYLERDLPGCRLGNMSVMSLELCRRTFRKALKRVALAAFPAEWSAQAARVYCRDHGKIKVIPFGANVSDPGPQVARGRTWSKVKSKDCFELLFVGKDWIRKGGDVAVETVRYLNAHGFKTRLHVVGTKIPLEAPPEQVKEYGLLDKSKPEDLRLLYRLHTDADAFILPSSSEGYNNSILIAAAFGLPTLGYDADGVREAIAVGRSGLLFPLGSPAKVFADGIRKWQVEPAAYESLVVGARHHYETRADWRTSVNTLIACIEDALRIPAPGPLTAIV